MGPVALPHVQLAFEVGGYKNTHESVYLTARIDAPPPEPKTAGPVRIEDGPAEMLHAPMAESWQGFCPRASTAWVGPEKVGAIGWTLTPQVAERLGESAMTIWSLWVKKEHQRKGFGAALTARALANAFAAGARFASLGTQLWNAPAHATYAKLGFTPHGILVGRTLDLEAAKTKPT
jgi:ribosomal protein S18 acetylase RimI-like enzyme